MDDIDRAQDAQMRDINDALKRRRRNIGESLKRCIDCDAPIPEERRRAAPGCTRCAPCQQEFERRRN